MPFKNLWLLLIGIFLINCLYSQTITPSGPVTFCQGGNVVLTAPTGTTYQWQNNGTNIAFTTRTYTATTSGSYTVIVTTAGTPTTYGPVAVTVNPKPIPDFTFDNNNACSGTTIHFTSSITSGTGPFTYSWNFGDAQTSTNQDPTHAYTSLGCTTASFNVTLTVTDANGCSNTITKSVTVKQAPNIDITDQDAGHAFSNCYKNPTRSNPNYTLTILNSSNSTCTSSYAIDWGDGTTQNNISFPITHLYTQLGAFNLIVTAVGTNGCTSSKGYVVANQSNAGATFGTIPNTTTGCAPYTVPLLISDWQNNSPGTSYLLDFGDGSSITLQHPIKADLTTDTIYHTYQKSSCPTPTFVATLYVKNACATTPYSAGNIQIRSKPTASFTTPISACINQTFCFNNTTISGSQGNNCSNFTTYLWDFGDGTSTSNQQSPCHTYSSLGTFTVTLSTTNDCGTSTISKQICVTNPPIATFTIDNAVGCTPLTVNTTNTSNTLTNCIAATYLWTVTYTSSNCGTSSSWSFGNNTTSASVNPTFIFTNPGTYKITLSVTNGCGTISSNTTVTVKKPPTVSITNITNGCSPLTINPSANVTNCGVNPLSYVWSFTGGSPASSNNLSPGPIVYSTPGTYNISLAITNECGTTTVTQPLTVSPVPDLNVPGPIVVCAGGLTGPLSFSSSATGVTYSWTNSNTAIGLAGSGTSNPIPSFTAVNNTASAITATINVTVRTSAGCSFQQTFTITVNPKPSISNQTIAACSGSSFTVTPTGAIIPAGTTYSWAAPAVTGGLTGGAAGSGQTLVTGMLTNPTNIIQTATYTVTPVSGAAGNCAGNTFTVTVTVNPIPSITGTQNNPTSCTATNGSIVLTGLAPNTTYNVQYTKNSVPLSASNFTSNASGVITIANLSSGTYTNVIATFGGCPSNPVGPFTLVNPSAPATPTASSNSPLCTGGTLTLTATGGATGAVYNWTGPASFTSTTQNPTRTVVTTAMAGTYSVTVTLNGCTSAPATVDVIINATPSAPTATSPVSYCQNESALPLAATASAGNTLNWYTVATGGTAGSTAPTPNTTSVGSTTYYVSQTNTTTPACESGRTSIVVNVKALPVITGSYTDPTSCTSSDGTIKLSGLTAGLSYIATYTKNSGTPTTITLTANASGILTITGLSAGSYASITATLNNCPSNAVGPFTLVNPSAPATPTASANSPLCTGSTLSLTAGSSSAGAVYNWTGPASFTSQLQNPTRTLVTTAMAGTYSVTVTLNGCVSSPATVNVVINATPPAPTATTPVSYCQNEIAVPLTASPSAGNTLNWYTVATGGTASATAPTPGTSAAGSTSYYVSQINTTTPACESGRTPIVVTVKAVPVITGTSTDPTSCISSDGTIKLSGLTANTSYSVTYTKNSGTPTTVTLSSNTTGVITIANLSAGSYTNITARLNGCASNAVGPFTIVNPSAPATPNASSNSPICSGSTLNLTANTTSVGNTTYAWTGPNGFISNQQKPVIANVTVAANGTYKVIVTLNGCISAAGSVDVIINSAGVVSAGSNGPICSGSTLNLTSSTTSTSAISFSWTGPNNFTSSQQNPTVSNASPVLSGVYTVTATSAQGSCTSSTTTNVVITAIPVISSASYIDPINCTVSTGTITLNGLTPNTSYVVQYTKNGAAPTTATLSSNSNGVLNISNLPDGTYSNISVSINGCISNLVGPFTLINTNPSPATPAAASNSPLCAGSTLNLSANSPTLNVTYTWSGPNGFTSNLQNPFINNVSVAQAGKYYVNTNVNSCSSAKDSINVLIGDYPTVNLGPDLTLAPGIQHQMQVVIQNGPISQYTWSPATNLSCANCALPTANIQTNITYTLTVKNIYGCSASDTINIKVSCDPSQIFIPNAFTPDGDGVNDLLIIRGTGTIKYFRIFNRWGEMVFEKMNFHPDNANYGWDGKVKGVVGPPDVYVYTAEAVCDNGAILTYKGNITILK